MIYELGSRAGKLEAVTGKVKEKWGNMTDYDLTAIDGKRNSSRAKSRRYGYAKDKARKEVEDWMNSL